MSEAQVWRRLYGVNPVGQASGDGGRGANHALWRVVLVRMSNDPDTRAYVERRTKEGKSKREIMRSSSATSPGRSTRY